MATKPNIVLIFADDLGIGDISIFNENPAFKTENIDDLARAGMRFTNSHATSALCTPSRYGLLTGRYNWRSRLKSTVIPGDSETLIEKNRETLALMLKKEGYHTAAVGKWHLGLDWQLKNKKDYEKYGLDSQYFKDKEPKHQAGRPYFGNTVGGAPVTGLDIDYSKPIKFGPNDYGFDYFFGTAASLDQAPFVIIENDRALGNPVDIMGNEKVSRISPDTPHSVELGVKAPEYNPYNTPDIMQNKVMELLEDFTKEEDPFFLYYPTHLVHGPIVPQERFRGQSGIGEYGDFVLQLDSYVGEIVDHLKKTNQFENTIFIFTSDNGAAPILDFKDLKQKGHDPSGGYRGTKFHIWEGGHREPTIISYPKVIEKGAVSNHLISHSDFYATIAELLDVTLEDDTAEDSYSNLNLWKGKDESVRNDIIHSSGNGGLAIRRDFWKLILVKNGGVLNDYDRNIESFKETFRPTELYDLRDDISEEHNVIDEHKEIVDELTKALERYVKDGRTTEGTRQENAPDLPTGDWEQLAWMDDYEEYVSDLNQRHSFNEE